VADPEAEGRPAGDAEADLKEQAMANDLDPLILDLLEWIDREPRSHAEVIDVWRTSCPRLTVWEDAMDRGFAVREHKQGRETMVRLTAAGRDFLRQRGRIANATTDAARSGPPFASGRIAAPVYFAA
jgi:hypothetical protein